VKLVEHVLDNPHDKDARVSRAGLIRRSFALLAAGGGAAVGASELEAATGSRRSLAHDHQILTFGLLIERLQAAFYADALTGGRLTGEVRQFAEVVGAQEQEHVKFVAAAVGAGAAGKSPKFRFGDTAKDPAKFIATAVSLEEAGLAVYNGQAVELTSQTLAAAARLVSVEARHAAWARALAGRDPAPVAVDAPITVAQATKAFRPFLA
jgi:hypothetical protein